MLNAPSEPRPSATTTHAISVIRTFTLNQCGIPGRCGAPGIGAPGIGAGGGA
jgi:hypothetical protein